MSIEIQCGGCGQKIRVGDEHAGKKARCPACGTISQVPSSADPAPAAPGPFEPAATKPLPDGSPFATGPAGSPNPFGSAGASPSPYTTGGPTPNPYATGGMNPMGRRLKPHRGGLILGLAIAGLLCCMPLAIAAWIMGAIDMGAIKRGEMDPEGRSLTFAGMILGIVATAIGVLWTLFSVLASLG